MKNKFKLLLAACAAALPASGSVAADFTMRIAAGAPSASFVCTDLLPTWAGRIKEASGGRIDYQIFCDGRMGKIGEALSRVEQGLVEAAWDFPLAYGKRFQSYSAITLPGLYDDTAIAAGALWNLYEGQTLPGLSGARLALTQATSNLSIYATAPIEDVSDLAGKKIAVGSKERAIMIETAGGVPLSVRFPEYHQALSKGAVEGILSTNTVVTEFALGEVLNQEIRGDFGGGLMFVAISEKWYGALPDDLKSVVDANSGHDASVWASKLVEEDAVGRLKKLIEEGQLDSRELSESEREKLKPAFEAATKAWLAGAENGEAMLGSVKAAIQLEVEAGK